MREFGEPVSRAKRSGCLKFILYTGCAISILISRFSRLGLSAYLSPCLHTICLRAGKADCFPHNSKQRTSYIKSIGAFGATSANLSRTILPSLHCWQSTSEDWRFSQMQYPHRQAAMAVNLSNGAKHRSKIQRPKMYAYSRLARTVDASNLTTNRNYPQSFPQ